MVLSSAVGIVLLALLTLLMLRRTHTEAVMLMVTEVRSKVDVDVSQRTSWS